MTKRCAVMNFGRVDFNKVLEKLNDKFEHVQVLEDLPDLKNTEVQVLCIVGGDGSMRRTAEYLMSEKIDLPLLGIAGGTANLGPLIRFDLHRLDFLDESNFFVYPVDCLEVSVNGKTVGFAFVDVVLSSFVVGFTGNTVENLDPEFFSRGSFVEGIKKAVGDGRTKFSRNGVELDHGINEIKQVIASPSNPKNRFAGRLASGICAWTSFHEHSGVLTVSEDFLLDADLRRDETTGRDFIRISQILFGSGDVIGVENLRDGTALILDGEPTISLKHTDHVRIGIVEDAVKVVSNLPKSLDLAPIGDVGRLHR